MASSSLKYTISSRLGVQASEVHEPYFNSLHPSKSHGLGGAADDDNAAPRRVSESGFNGLPILLIFFGCLVFALALAALVYLCVIRRR